jgi:hypothetical protein
MKTGNNDEQKIGALYASNKKRSDVIADVLFA